MEQKQKRTLPENVAIANFIRKNIKKIQLKISEINSVIDDACSAKVPLVNRHRYS